MVTLTEQAQRSEIRDQILSADTMNGQRFSKTATPLIWLETAQSTHLDAAYSPGRGCSPEAPLYPSPIQKFQHRMYGRSPLEEAWAPKRESETSANFAQIDAPSDLLKILRDLSEFAVSHNARYRILAFEIQQLRARGRY
jgi:hypothetical protein